MTTEPARESPNRLPIVGVMGSGTDAHRDRASDLGLWLGSQGVHLLTGGGPGVMEAVSKAFCSVRARAGKSIGVLPGQVNDGMYHPIPGYPNPWVELPVRTHLPLSSFHGTQLESRNHINILTPDVIVALPGSHGTASEVQLAVQYGKPLVAYVSASTEIPGLPDGIYVESDFEKVKSFVRSHIG